MMTKQVMKRIKKVKENITVVSKCVEKNTKKKKLSLYVVEQGKLCTEIKNINERISKQNTILINTIIKMSIVKKRYKL